MGRKLCGLVNKVCRGSRWRPADPGKSQIQFVDKSVFLPGDRRAKQAGKGGVVELRPLGGKRGI